MNLIRGNKSIGAIKNKIAELKATSNAGQIDQATYFKKEQQLKANRGALAPRYWRLQDRDGIRYRRPFWQYRENRANGRNARRETQEPKKR